ncbi:MAG: hypothetical protein AVO39_03380 [delta proteobacterium MLS_D]|nr:MAG: hypothetical protein AVO39_03380 [delta proteobacterium MLS_D]
MSRSAFDKAKPEHGPSAAPGIIRYVQKFFPVAFLSPYFPPIVNVTGTFDPRTTKITSAAGRVPGGPDVALSGQDS